MENPEHKKFANAAHPLNWYEVAKLMHENAHALHNMPQGAVSYSDGVECVTRPTSNRPVFLLAAFALENLIKAFLIYENPYFIEGGKLSLHLLNGHGLSKLQKKCRKVPSPKRTLHVFETLEVGVNSWARYPCATSIDRESVERTVTTGFWKAYNDVLTCTAKDWSSSFPRNGRGRTGRSVVSHSHEKPNKGIIAPLRGSNGFHFGRSSLHFSRRIYRRSLYIRKIQEGTKHD